MFPAAPSAVDTSDTHIAFRMFPAAGEMNGWFELSRLETSHPLSADT